MTIKIRQATTEDLPFVLEITTRLSAFGPPPWRDAADVVEGEARTLRDFFDAPDPSSTLLIAQTDSGDVAWIRAARGGA